LGTNARQINALSQPLGRITGQADEFTKSMAAANARVLAFGASAGILAGVSKALSGIVTNTIKVEKSLANINVVLNKSGAELEKFGNQLFDVAKNTGQTFDQVAEAATELARQGLSASETLSRLNDSLILSRLSGLDAAKSVEGLTAAFNSFSSSGATTSEILNKLVVVSQKFAVSEKDLIEGLKRSSAVANQAGVSLDELIGIITAVQEKTARGGAVIGNSFKTIFSRIQDRKVLSDLDQIGIQVVDLQGKVLPATTILQNLATSFKSFSQLEQSDIAEKLGGIYQLSNLLAAIEDLGSETSKYTEAVKLSSKATNEAYSKNAALNQTLDALINKVTVSAEQLGATLGKIGVTDSLKNILSFFNGLLEGIQKILGEESALGDLFRGIAKGIGAFAAGPGLALFGAIILKLSKDLVQFGFASLKSFFGIGKAAKEVQSVEMSIQQILTRNVDLQQKLFALEGDRAGQLQVITNALIQQEALLRKTASTASSLGTAVYNVGGRATPSGLRINPPTAAGGYVPAVAKESADINRGVGGARSGDKPVVIPNFNFGGGKIGSMVAHTGEYIVPNFAGNGSAIFNRDMVRSMGLPSGARKINAAGGFIANFAEKMGPAELLQSIGAKSIKDLEQYRVFKDGKPTQAFDIGGNIIRESAAAQKLNPLGNIYDANSDPKTIMLIPQTAAYAVSGLRTFFTKKKEVGGKVYDSFDGGYAGLDPQLKSGGLKENSKFKKLSNIDQEMNEALAIAASRILESVSPDIKTIPASLTKENIGQYLEAGGAGALGSIRGALFESVINIITSSIKDTKQGTLDLSFDAGNNRAALEELFGVEGKNVKYADFKNSLGQKDKFIDQVMRNFPNRASRGYIPNFANPLQDAVDREMAAGVPASQIYIDKSPSLKNAANPMGLMVANRRDEPAGGFQGINRAMKEGKNPQTYGAAGGFVPNYAAAGAAPTGPDLAPFVGKTVPEATKKIQEDLTDSLSNIVKKYDDQLQELEKSRKELANKAKIEKDLVQVAKQLLADAQNDLTNAQKAGDSVLNQVILKDRIAEKAAQLGAATQQRNETKKEYLSTRQSIRGLPSERVKEENAARTNAAALTTAVSANAKRGLMNPIAPRVVDPNAPKKGMDLGVIFAIQGAMSALTGATDGATGGLGKFTNALSEGIGNFSTAAFAIQGVTSMGGAFGKFASKLGPYGLAIAGITAAYSSTAKYLDEVNGINAAAAKNIAKMSDAAQNAAFNLDKLPQAAQKNITDSAGRLVRGASVSSSYKYIGGGFGGTQPTKVERTAKVDFEGSDLLTAGELEKSLTSVTQAALGAGVSYDAMWNKIKDRSKDGKLTVAEVDELTTSFTKMMMTSDQLKESMRGLDLTPESTFSKSFGNISRDDLEKQLTGLTSGKKVYETTDIGKIQNAIFNSLTEEQQKSFDINSDAVKQQVTTVYNLLQDQKAAAKDAAVEAEKTFRINMSMFKAEAAFESKLNQNKDQIATEEVSKARKIADIENDTSISQLERQKRINEINNQYDTSIDRLNKQFEIVTNINNGLKESLSKASVQFGPEKIASVIPQLTESLKGLNPKEGGFTAKVQKELENVGLKGIDQTAFRELIASLSTILLTNQSITLELDRQEKKAGDALRVTNKGLDLKESQLSLEKQITAQIEDRNSKASFAIENRVLNNAYEALSVNREIERVKRDTALNELEKAEEVYKLELKRRDLESTGIGIGLEQQLLNYEQELRNAAISAFRGSSVLPQNILENPNVTTEQLLRESATDKGANATIQRAIDDANRKSELARKAAQNQQAGLSDITREGILDKVDRGFFGGISDSVRNLKAQTDTFAFDIGEKIPQMFSDNMSNAINKMIEGGESFSSVLRGAAYEFVKGINQANIKNLSDKFSNFLFKSDGGAASGIKSVLGLASGGKVSGGSGSKDDVPAMLMGGEYVINKNAVRKYGPQFFDSINNGQLSGFAKGGQVQKGPQGNFYTPGTYDTGAIEGKRNLLDFATQSGTSGQFDRIVNTQGYQSISLEPESSRLTVAGMRNSPAFEATQSAKQQAFDLYLQQYQQEQEAKRAEKEQKKAFRNQLIMLAATAAIGGVGKAAMIGGKNAVATLGKDAGFLQKAGAFAKGSIFGGDIGSGIMGGGLKNLFSGNFGLAYQSEILKALPIGAGSQNAIGKSLFSSGMSASKKIPSSYNQKDMIGGNIDLGPPPISNSGAIKAQYEKYYKKPDDKFSYRRRGYGGDAPSLLPPKGFAVGGMIPSTSGIDTVPAMLSGGEFIMNRSAVQNIGAGNLQSMNSGTQSVLTDEASKEMNEKLLSKLDELIEVSSGGGDITINVSGSGNETTTGANNQDASSVKQQLAREVKDAVLKVLDEQKRLGGRLRR
jgi:TP901 family phage tail tape measure protein